MGTNDELGRKIVFLVAILIELEVNDEITSRFVDNFRLMPFHSI